MLDIQPESMEEARTSVGPARTIEQALNKTERDADNALKAAERVVKGLKQLKHAAQLGEVRKLRAASEAVQETIGALDQEIANVGDSWEFDEESYLREGGYTKELLEQARAQKLQISEQDERLYSYPMLITIDPARSAVSIDRKTERRLRPSVLVSILQQRQKQPQRFKTAAFLESLYAAYGKEVRAQRGGKLDHGTVVRLLDLYQLLTLAPGAEKEYSLQEFTRDVHLLDVSGENTTRKGARVSFEASTGTKSGRGVLSILTKNGAEKRYYGISFSEPEGD